MVSSYIKFLLINIALRAIAAALAKCTANDSGDNAVMLQARIGLEQDQSTSAVDKQFNSAMHNSSEASAASNRANYICDNFTHVNAITQLLDATEASTIYCSSVTDLAQDLVTTDLAVHMRDVDIAISDAKRGLIMFTFANETRVRRHHHCQLYSHPQNDYDLHPESMFGQMCQEDYCMCRPTPNNTGSNPEVQETVLEPTLSLSTYSQFNHILQDAMSNLDLLMKMHARFGDGMRILMKPNRVIDELFALLGLGSIPIVNPGSGKRFRAVIVPLFPTRLYMRLTPRSISSYSYISRVAVRRTGTRRVLAGRRDPAGRGPKMPDRVLVEFHELQEALPSHDLVYFEDWNISQKYAEFAKIASIVFEHGSADANMLFMPSGARITILQPRSFPSLPVGMMKHCREYLRALAYQLGHKIQFLLGSEVSHINDTWSIGDVSQIVSRIKEFEMMQPLDQDTTW